MTQGRGDGQEWVTSFMVSHSVDGFHWQYVADVYGNQKVRTGVPSISTQLGYNTIHITVKS